MDGTSTTASGDTGTNFRWDCANQQYIFNYHTAKSPSGECPTITATLDDGTSQSITVAFR